MQEQRLKELEEGRKILLASADISEIVAHSGPLWKAQYFKSDYKCIYCMDEHSCTKTFN